MEPLPPWAIALIDAVMAAGIFAPEHRPNHVLVNEYGQAAGLDAHTDGPLYYPCVACLSLGGPVCMALWRPVEDAPVAGEQAAGERMDGGRGPLAQIVLQSRSLNVLSGDVYTNVMHGTIPHTALHTLMHRSLNSGGLKVQSTPGRD
eukprot:SAG31_NODE_5178_length_2697_cov_3.029638_6_plen_147_part_00